MFVFAIIIIWVPNFLFLLYSALSKGNFCIIAYLFFFLNVFVFVFALLLYSICLLRQIKQSSVIFHWINKCGRYKAAVADLTSEYLLSLSIVVRRISMNLDCSIFNFQTAAQLVISHLGGLFWGLSARGLPLLLVQQVYTYQLRLSQDNNRPDTKREKGSYGNKYRTRMFSHTGNLSVHHCAI